MKFSEQDIQTAIRIISKQVDNRSCQYCGRREWQLVPAPMALVGYDPEREEYHGKPALLAIVISCTKCGQFALFDIHRALGIFGKKD